MDNLESELGMEEYTALTPARAVNIAEEFTDKESVFVGVSIVGKALCLYSAFGQNANRVAIDEVVKLGLTFTFPEGCVDISGDKREYFGKTISDAINAGLVKKRGHSVLLTNHGSIMLEYISRIERFYT